MLYLSRLTLNPGQAQARRDLVSPYDLHRTLGKAFPDPESKRHRERHGVLFRIEEAGAGGVPILVQSTSAPDWQRLPQGYALRLDGPKSFEPALREGQHLRFCLVANPTKRATSKLDSSKKTRVPLKKEAPSPDKPDHQTHFAWLDRQGTRCGFEVPRSEDGVAMVQAVPFHVVTRKVERKEGKPPKTHRITLFGVRFDGVLRVTDSAKLAEAVRKGIGPAKAFGFGLLSLAPA